MRKGLLNSGSVSLQLMKWHRQVISSISKGSRNILIYNFIISPFDYQGRGISASTFALAHSGLASPLLLETPLTLTLTLSKGVLNSQLLSLIDVLLYGEIINEQESQLTATEEEERCKVGQRAIREWKTAKEPAKLSSDSENNNHTVYRYILSKIPGAGCRCSWRMCPKASTHHHPTFTTLQSSRTSFKPSSKASPVRATMSKRKEYSSKLIC